MPKAPLPDDQPWFDEDDPPEWPPRRPLEWEEPRDPQEEDDETYPLWDDDVEWGDGPE